MLYGAQIVPDRSPSVLTSVDFAEDGNDTLAGYNVQSIALELPASALALKGDAERNPVIGIWSDSERPRSQVLSKTNGAGGVDSVDKGPQVQVSRLGHPLVNEVVIPLRDKDKFNSSTPSQDGQFLGYVTDPEVPKLFEAIYDIPASAGPRNNLVEVFLTGICAVPGCLPTVADVNLNSQRLNADVHPKAVRPGEMLRLNTSIKPTDGGGDRLGVLAGDLAGFPNGRRLTDDVLDIELQVLEGELIGRPNAMGDAVSENDVEFTDDFPFVGIPHTGAVNGTDDDSSNSGS